MQLYKLAQEINVSSQVVLKTLKAWGADVRGHFHDLPESVCAQVRDAFTDYNAPRENTEPKPKAKKTTSKPWNDKRWVPDMFRLDMKRKGFHTRFVDKANVEKRIDEGWQIANIKDYIEPEKIDKRQRDEEAGPFGTALTRKGMVLMELPDDLHKAKKAYLDAKADNQSVEAQREQLKKRATAIEKELGNSVGMTDDVKVE